MAIKNYKDFIVWQKAMQAVKLLYFIVKKLPQEELFALSDQMRRCAVSIPSNIAEGQQRNSDAEFVRFEEETGIVYIKMLGACAGCGSLDATLKGLIESILLEEVEGVIGVENVTE